MKRNLLSIKTKLISAFMLGACLTFSIPAISTLAATGDDEKLTIQIQSVVPNDALTEKQIEIDKYLFKEHAKDIEEKGFKVLQTVVINGYVEIGIAPYSEKNAEYLYSLFGKDIVKIIETEQSELMPEAYATTMAPDTKNGNVSSDPAAAEDDKLTIQIESIGNSDAVVSDIVTTMAAPEKADASSSVPVVALYAGISILAFGGILFILNKRKAVK